MESDNKAIQAMADPKRLLDAEERRLNLLVDTMLKVSSGMLALSVTFRKSISGDHPTAGWLLIAAWIAFTAVPVLCCLIHLILAVRDSELFIWLMRDVIPKDERPDTQAIIGSLSNLNMWVWLITGGCFLFGLGFFCAFAVINL